MQITEIRKLVTADQTAQLAPIFREAFDTSPSTSFLERLNEKSDLSVLLAHDEDAIIGFKIGYTRFKGIFFSGWVRSHSATEETESLVNWFSTNINCV